MSEIQTNTILIVDDDPVVHKLLSAVLKQADYEVIDCFSGEEALKTAAENKPDLILLDIMMPEMDGFQVIETLKANEALAEIPVIFLSSRVDSADKVRTLEMGASDFIHKPFDRAELLARIQTHLKLKHHEEALKLYSQNLEQMVAVRTRQLIHADRLASLGTLAAGIAHEINNPTTFITGNLQTMEQFWEIIAPKLAGIDDRKIEYIIKEFPDMLKSIRSGAERISNIVAGLKAFSRKGSSVKKQTNLIECLEEALRLTHNRLKYYIQVKKDLPPDLPLIWANPQQLVQVFVNLLLNSSDAIGEKEGTVTITARAEPEGFLKLILADDGCGIQPGVRSKIFDPFFTTKPLGQGTGLGLSITHGIIIDHRGTIDFESQPDRGTVFTILFPTEQPDDPESPADA